MSEQATQRTCRKTYKEKLRPPPTQERALERVRWHCRTRYHTALEQRITAWERCHVCVTRSQQEAELKAIRAELPEYAALHSHVLQDVLARLDTTSQAFCRRLANGEQPGFPRFQGRDRWHSFTYKEEGNGARLENGSLVLAKIGRIAVRWSRPVQGTIKTVIVARAADGWYVCFSCAEVAVEPLPRTGRETGIDVGLTVLLLTADGRPVENPRHYRRAERALKKAQQRVSRRKKGSHRRRKKGSHRRRKKGSHRRRKAVRVLAQQHQQVRRQRHDCHHTTALALVRAYDTIDVAAIQPANLSRRPAPRPDGNGGYAHNGASPKAGLNTSMQDALVAPLPLGSRLHGSMRREARGSGASGVYVAGLVQCAGRWHDLWRTHRQDAFGAHAYLPHMRVCGRPRRERG